MQLDRRGIQRRTWQVSILTGGKPPVQPDLSAAQVLGDDVSILTGGKPPVQPASGAFAYVSEGFQSSPEGSLRCSFATNEFISIRFRFNPHRREASGAALPCTLIR